eukprot:6201119-Lingulodinium_polyedra.AAC.1
MVIVMVVMAMVTLITVVTVIVIMIVICHCHCRLSLSSPWLAASKQKTPVQNIQLMIVARVRPLGDWSSCDGHAMNVSYLMTVRPVTNASGVVHAMSVSHVVQASHDE